MRVVRAAAGLLILLGQAGAAAAHGGEPHGEAGWDPWVVLPLLLAALAFAVGAFRLAGRARRFGLARRAGLLAAGLGTVALALLSPLAAAAHASFAAHMVEHELLMVVAAPLLILARPLGPWLWALPLGARRACGRVLHAPGLRRGWRIASAPAVASGLQAIALWGWHVPALFQMALESAAAHRLQHLCFLGTALLFWWSLLAAGRTGYGAAALHLFVASAQAGLLGVLFLFAARPLLPLQGAGAAAYGLTPLQDQQLAGIVMAGAACLVYPAVALRLLQLWIAAGRRRRRGAADALQPV
jgi:putative membrane protein